MDPETAHRLTVRMLQVLPRAGGLPPDPPILATRLWGLPFANPVGLAAGFDKNAEVADRLPRFGFGFVEVGGVTPRPQPGNPKPRVFRLPEDRAVINRLGFNNDGLEIVRRRLEAMRPSLVPLGVNLGVNKDSADRLADFVQGVEALHGLVDYYTVNVSSPNTPGLRQLQEKAQLAALLQAVVQARDALDAGAARRSPVLVKLAPDLGEAELADVAEVTLASRVDGAVIGNTSTGLRDGLRSARGREPGGLSGTPLFALSTEVLRRFRRHTQGRLPLIGCGGVDSGRAAYAKIRAGASLVQLYTALVYEGPGLVSRIKRELVGLLQADGFANVADAVGVDAG